MIRDFIVRAAEDNHALLGTEVVIKAQDGHTFVPGNNIENGEGVGELGAGWAEPDGMISVTHWDGRRTTPRIPLHRLYGPDGQPNTGEMGLRVVDGPFGPQTRLEVILPFA
jgi:hypothetical protein